MDYAANHPILFRKPWNATGLDRALEAVDLPALRKEYVSLRDKAPSRSSRGKKYFVEHDGVPATTKLSNRREEHAAIALCNLRRHWQLPSGTGFRLLDYQFPLWSSRQDKGIRAADLVGVTDQGRLIVAEFKLEGKDGGRGDAPGLALMEALRYAAIIEANLGAIAAEASKRFGIGVQQAKPQIQLLATQEYWRRWKACEAAGSWQAALATLITGIESSIGIPIDCLALDDFHVVVGKDEARPRLDPPPTGVRCLD